MREKLFEFLKLPLDVAEMEKQQKRSDEYYICHRRRIIAGIVIIVVVFILISSAEVRKPKEKTDNVILRHYTEIMKDVDEEPKNISLHKYKSNIPKTLQKDIERMLERDASIVYYNDNGGKIVIEPSDSETGYKVRFEQEFSKKYRYNLMEDVELERNLSFYKAKDKLVIYGGEGRERTVSRYYMDNEKMNYNLLENYYVDLYGTKMEYDDIREYTSHATLIRKGTEFSFYYLGNKVYITSFKGGEVSKWSYDYLISTTKDCYNVYYSMNPNDYWIRFCKVAENVDEVLDEEVTIMDEDANEMNFPIFKIGNKKYAQIPNLVAERAYGQSYGKNYGSQEEKEKIDFTSELVEVCSSNSSKVELKYSYNDEWILRYYFQGSDRECFLEKRINGLDSEVAKKIPKEKIEKFNDKVISPGQVKKYINQLKKLYDKYTNNEF